MLKDASSKLDKRVELMHQDFLDASRTVSLQSSAMLGMLSSTHETRFSESLSLGSTTPYRGFVVEALESSNSSIMKCIGMSLTQHTADQVSTENEQDCFVDPFCAQRASLLELSPNFRPESYTSRSMLPKVVINQFYEESSSISARTNCYRILYLQSRRWVHFNVSLEIPRSSIYWTIAKVSRHQDTRLSLVAPFCVPVSLLGRLQRSLEKLENIKENACIRLRCSDDDTRGLDALGIPQPVSARLICNTLPKSSKPTERAILASLHHLGCPRYPEDKVVPLASLEFPDKFIACFEGELVVEVKSPHQPPSSDFLYTIQLLHCLRGATGIVRLVGVIFDTAKHHLKSYMIKLPDSKCELLLHRASNLSSPHSWRQIECWTRQLVQRMITVHTRGYVVGTLWCQRPPILVDAFEQLHLWLFTNRIHIRPTASPFYPPEFRHYAKLCGTALDPDENPVVTPEFDIFQLGLLLWILAESWSSGQSALSVKEQFYKACKAPEW